MLTPLILSRSQRISPHHHPHKSRRLSPLWLPADHRCCYFINPHKSRMLSLHLIPADCRCSHFVYPQQIADTWLHQLLSRSRILSFHYSPLQTTNIPNSPARPPHDCTTCYRFSYVSSSIPQVDREYSQIPAELCNLPLVHLCFSRAGLLHAFMHSIYQICVAFHFMWSITP